MINSMDEVKRVTNLDYLLDLSKGNTQFVREMIDTFLEENPKEIESLEKAIQSNDFEAVKQTAHLLQSSIPFVGLDKIIETEVYEMEKIAADKSAMQKIETLFSKVKDVCERAHLELKNS